MLELAGSETFTNKAVSLIFHRGADTIRPRPVVLHGSVLPTKATALDVGLQMREGTRVGSVPDCARRQTVHSLPRLGPVLVAPGLRFFGAIESSYAGLPLGVESYVPLIPNKGNMCGRIKNSSSASSASLGTAQLQNN
jgi:hypothetical protein